jgi:hypothetical protein
MSNQAQATAADLARLPRRLPRPPARLPAVAPSMRGLPRRRAAHRLPLGGRPLAHTVQRRPSAAPAPAGRPGRALRQLGRLDAQPAGPARSRRPHLPPRRHAGVVDHRRASPVLAARSPAGRRQRATGRSVLFRARGVRPARGQQARNGPTGSAPRHRRSRRPAFPAPVRRRQRRGTADPAVPRRDGRRRRQAPRQAERVAACRRGGRSPSSPGRAPLCAARRGACQLS